VKGFVTRIVQSTQQQSRAKRARVFRDIFALEADTKVLDIGSEDGSHIADVLKGSPVKPENVFIADIDEESVARGSHKFGFVPVVIPESGRLPFQDKYFDIVYCSSVIEHVTVPKEKIWSIQSGREFRARSWDRQREFANEIDRLASSYYVQTPNKYFIVESHTWLPFIGYLPRRLLLPVLRVSNQIWVKQTTPDWNLLSAKQMQLLFPEGELLRERLLGIVKSIIIVKRRNSATV